MTDDGRIRVPADLDAVTSVGDEDHSDDRLRGRRPDLAGRAALVCRRACTPRSRCACGTTGRVVLNRAIGHGWGNGPDDPADAEKVAVTTRNPVLRLLRGQGDVAPPSCTCSSSAASSRLDDRVCDYLPELHQSRQGPHHHPARDDAQRGRAVRTPGRSPTSSGWTTASTPARCSAT